MILAEITESMPMRHMGSFCGGNHLIFFHSSSNKKMLLYLHKAHTSSGLHLKCR